MFQCKPFTALTPSALFMIMRTRVDVFVVEQACAYPELDDNDIAQTTQHVYLAHDNILHAYARCYEKNSQYSAIGRVLVNQSKRGTGLSYKLVNHAIECCKRQWPERDVYIGAQTYLIDFYRSFGFECINDAYFEDGIAHQDMVLCQSV